ncbi:RNA polymerase sigma factor [Pseudomonas sp. CGJS7]|uniref:RNA polymerase sigma factor n=1 Tax=Pseudomonas sp. CGJS7 TaxID=3109348 RepID=UPI00300A7E83
MSSNAALLTSLLVTERERLLRYLRRYLDRAEAEDALQSMYFKVIAVAGEPPILDPRHYLYRLAHHHAVDQGRAEARRRKLREAAAAWLAEDDALPDTARVVLAQSELASIAKAARDLPERSRQIFALNRFEGLTQREIAAQLQVSTTTVEKHIQRVLRLLDQAREGR